jgi:hypothetical protein
VGGEKKFLRERVVRREEKRCWRIKIVMVWVGVVRVISVRPIVHMGVVMRG